MDDLILKRKLEEMIQYGYVAMSRFPKSERFTLVADIKASMYAALRLTITANKRYHKRLKWLYQRGKTTLARVKQSVRSWVAHCDYCDSWRVRRRILGDAVFTKPEGL